MQLKWLKLKNGKVCKMKYHNITKEDMLNGDGLRVVLWVSGCDHGCPGCQNPLTWDPEDGLVFDESAMAEIYEQLDKSYISGITITGGDPLYHGNREAVAELIRDVREKYPNKTIWLYTGYCWEDISMLPCISDVDVVVDGRFILAEQNNTLYWKGSRNQRVIDVKKTKETGAVVIHNRL